jgi:hypothetical protein
MYAIWVVIALATLTGTYALLGNESAPATTSPSEMSLAQNMSLYRQAVVAYAQANPSFAGSVPVNRLTLAAGTPDPVWRNYVTPNVGYVGSLVVVYAASPTAPAVVIDIEQLAQGSALAGSAYGGAIDSPGNPEVPLPGGVAASVPNGVPVWMAQAYE